jgi:uncharacterized protein YjbI with pentapeptide repeats
LWAWILRGCQGKTSWEWLDLLSKLLIPVWIAILVLMVEGQREDRLTQMQVDAQESIAQAQLEIEAERARQAVLDTYLRDMRELTLDKGLTTSQHDAPVVDIAQVNTQIAISQLDTRRNASIVIFLAQSGLLDLISLDGINLSEAHLQNANLSSAILSNANLTNADLSGADLSDTNPRGAILSGANLGEANLGDADLTEADLHGAILSGVNLRDANLWVVRGWTNEQLARARFLNGATLPSGTVMTEEAWEEFKKRHRQ